MPTVGGIVVSTGGAPTTGRRTLLEVVDELARPVNASDTTIRALAKDAFRAAVNKFNRKGCWPWEVMDEDIAITSGVIFSTATGVIKKPLAMHKLHQAGGIPDERITYISYDRFVETWNMNYSTNTFSYTIPNLFETGQIRWIPTPGANDNARFTYYRVTPAPRNESETIEIPDYAIEAYQSVAWYEFLKRLPSQQRPYDIGIAQADAKQAFREISAHVTEPGDSSREVSVYG